MNLKSSSNRQLPNALWSNYLVILCGLWLLSSPFSFGPFSFGDEEIWMRVSDLGTGALLIFFSTLSLFAHLSWPRWINGGLGVWLTFAPLAFWTSSAAAYANGNLIGSLVIISSVILPSLWPSLLRKEDELSETPSQWTYNPSSWNQRIPIIGLAVIGFLLAKYLAAFQLGHIPSVWDPFFGKGTETILRSDVSRAFPVSDAGLGAWSYLLDALSGAWGSQRRWRTMPWVVILFGLMVIPPGVTSIVLVILQPVAVGAWCTICLVTAAVMLLMVPPAIDEVVATGQFLIQSRREGKPFWPTFWRGDLAMQALREQRPMELGSHRRQSEFGRLGKTASLLWTLRNWTLLISAALGIWLMAAPTVFGMTGLAADSNHLLGALIVTVAVIAMAQVARPIRFLNCVFGVILAIGIWFIPDGTLIFQWNSALTGIMLFILSIPLGQIVDRFGNYDRIIRWSPLLRRRSVDRNQDKAA